MDGKTCLLVVFPSPVFGGFRNSCLSKKCGIVSDTVGVNTAAKTYLIALFICCDTKECICGTGYIDCAVLDEIVKGVNLGLICREIGSKLEDIPYIVTCYQCGKFVKEPSKSIGSYSMVTLG